MALSGCLGEGTGAGDGFALLPLLEGQTRALSSAELVPGRVVAKGPDGYCIDKSSFQSGVSGFALIVPCVALGAEGSGLQTETVLMTIQAQPRVLSRSEASGDGLAEAFKDMQPLYTETGDGISLIQLGRGGNASIPGGEPKHWRAALSFNGYLVGLALYSEADGIAASEAGKMLLLTFAEEVLSASPIASAAPAPLPEAAAPEPKRPKLFSNFFN